MNAIHRFRHWLILIALCAATGCQSMNPADMPLPWSSGDKVIASAYQTPERMAAIWTDATYNAIGEKSVRGFGGRLYFYNQQGAAVPVEGQLVIYAFDDSDQQGPARKPSRKFVFTPEQFTERFSETDLGSSYSIWLPWDQIGGEPKSITLLPIFTASGGQVLTGEQSINLLPGVKPKHASKEYFSRVEPESVGARPSLSKVQRASYTDGGGAYHGAATAVHQATSVGGETDHTLARMETTTIKPRGHLAERILAQQRQSIQREGTPVAGAGRWVETAPATPPANFSRRPGEGYRGDAHALRPAKFSVPEGAVRY